MHEQTQTKAADIEIGLFSPTALHSALQRKNCDSEAKASAYYVTCTEALLKKI